MGGDSIPLWIVFLICVIGGAYFAATESSFSAVNKIKVKTLAEDGNKRAKGVMYILNRFDKALTTLLVGNNVTKIAGASVFTILATGMFREAGKSEEYLSSFEFSIICSVASTVIIFLFSEMIPKSFANDRSESVSLFFQSSLRLLMKLLAPISAFFNLISAGASKLFAAKEVEPSITEDELSEIIETAEEEGVVDEEQGDMLKSVLEFSEKTVAEIMTMEKDIDFVELNAPLEQIVEKVHNSNYSRMPVYAGNPRRIVGTLRTRTFLTEYRKDPKVKLRSIMHPPFVVRDTAKIDDLLTDMRQRKRHMAIVQDENKQTLGLVTIEDILEELVGEIFDEEDVVDQNFHAQGGNKYLVNTRMQIDEMYSRMGLEPPVADIAKKPLLSFMLEKLGHFPEEGESFLYDNLEITAKTSDGDRVTEAVVHILDEEGLAKLIADSEEVRI